MAETQGLIPLRSLRKAAVGELPTAFPSGVTISRSTYVLTFVESIERIETGPICGRETVDCWVLDNGILRVKAIAMGGNLVSIEKDGREYIWQNKAGATYYGAGSDAFPLTRGLILHGGIRVAAVTAEHGLYYDSDWDMAFAADPSGSSIVLSIRDSAENRALLCDTLSRGQFSAPGSDLPMSKYPVTDALFAFEIGLRPGEDFVRLRAGLINSRDSEVVGEIWMPQTYPVNADAQVISHQQKRRCKDLWVYQGMLKDNYLAQDMRLDPGRDLPEYRGKTGFLVGCPPTPTSWNDADLNKPLAWPTGSGGILYDYPRRDGDYHALSYGDGRGIAYLTLSDSDRPHYTKMWSWGNPALFNRQQALTQNPPLAAGRPKTDYYEPWGSAFNTGFFETCAFGPGESAWQAFILPIESGLDNGMSQQQLRKAVDARVAPIVARLEEVLPAPGVKSSAV